MISSARKIIKGNVSPGAAYSLESLIRYARDGDYDAFEALARFYWAPVYRMVYYRIRSKMDAEDITQDVFFTAFKRINCLKETSKFRSWLFTIAINRVRDYQRRSKLLGLLGFSVSNTAKYDLTEFDAQGDESPLGGAIRRDFWKQVDRFLASLSKAEKEVFVLRFMDQLNINEIAEVMGKGQSTIKTHLYRAVKKFKSWGQFHTFLEGLE